jgi:TonB family protein
MRRSRRTLPACILVVLSLGIPQFSVSLQAGSELEQHLRDQYQGKTLILRNFYEGASLRYDASGQLSKAAASGDWTVDGVVQIVAARVSGPRLSIRARRLRMGWTRDTGFRAVPAPAGKAGKDFDETGKLSIEADLGPDEVTDDGVDALLARIFLTPQDSFAELMPEYWKPCVLAGVAEKPSKQYAGCQFSAEFLDIPGVRQLAQQESGSPEAASPTAERIFRPGKGLTAPKAIYHREPEFSEEARIAKYQGTTILMIVVDQTGVVRNVRIARPLGCGLDQRAVETVKMWKFDPAQRDGEPIEAEIAVEVSFHLY